MSKTALTKEDIASDGEAPIEKIPDKPAKTAIFLVRIQASHFELFTAQSKRTLHQKLSRLATNQDGLEDIRFRPIGYVENDMIFEVRGSIGKRMDEDKIEDYVSGEIPTMRIWNDKHDSQDFPPIPKFSITNGLMGILFIPSGLEMIYNAWTVTAYRWMYSKAYGVDVEGTYSLVIF